jgi:hypothetical protein
VEKTKALTNRARAEGKLVYCGDVVSITAKSFPTLMHSGLA